MIYLVSYDLIGGGKNYEEISQAIKDASNGYFSHCLTSTWIIQSELKTANDVFAKIKPCLDSNDLCIVIETTTNRQGILKKPDNDMIKDIFS